MLVFSLISLIKLCNETVFIWPKNVFLVTVFYWHPFHFLLAIFCKLFTANHFYLTDTQGIYIKQITIKLI